MCSETLTGNSEFAGDCTQAFMFFGIGDARRQINSLLEIGKNDIYIFLITSALAKV